MVGNKNGVYELKVQSLKTSTKNTSSELFP